MSIPYFISAVFGPVVGLFVDRYGMRGIIIALSAAMVCAVHWALAYSSIGAIIPLIGQGLAYTGYAAVLWPAVSLVVDEAVTGLGFGILTSVMNLSCAVVPPIVAGIYIASGDKYVPNVELLFLSLGGFGIIVGIFLNYFDYYWGHSLLNKSVGLDSIEYNTDDL
jgi:MFS family permease